MAKGIHKGSEYKNISETWDANEQQAGGTERSHEDLKLQKAIEKEAAEYDDANKEDRTLGGDRATVNDDE